MAEEVSVSLLFACGKGYDVHYLVQGREVDKSDMYASKPEIFQPGKYPFYWPGNASLFGGGINDGETPQQAFKREVKEELDLELSDEYLSVLELRTYRWREDTERILAESNEIFQGHVANFLGFSLDEKLPDSTLNRRDRQKYDGKTITYKDWLYDRVEDHYFAANIGERVELPDKEGAGAAWVPHWVARSICMVPVDKIALLDDMNKRIQSGELEIKVKR